MDLVAVVAEHETSGDGSLNLNSTGAYNDCVEKFIPTARTHPATSIRQGFPIIRSKVTRWTDPQSENISCECLLLSGESLENHSIQYVALVVDEATTNSFRLNGWFCSFESAFQCQ